MPIPPWAVRSLKAAVKYGPDVWRWAATALGGDDQAKQALQRGGVAALARHSARKHAATLAEGRYGPAFWDGRRYWIAWSGDTPVAAYPPFDGDLEELVRHVDRGLLRDPRTMPPVRLPKRR